jgi:hypothetical protein
MDPEALRWIAEFDHNWVYCNWDDPNRPWYEAMDALEQRGDKKPLIKMLLDPKCEVTPAVRECLADLLKRHTLVRLPHEQQIPIYAVSQADLLFLVMTGQLLKLKENGTPHKEAIARVANDWNVDEDKLADAVNGKRGSLRRTQNRLARLMPKEWVHKRAAQMADPDWLMSRLREALKIDDPGE